MPIRVWQAVWRRLAAGAWALLIGLCLLADARANPQVQQMALERTAEGLYLNARLGLGATPDVEDALVRGVPLYFVWQADVTRSRWYWADKRLVSAVRVLRLAYQPLTRQWRLSIGAFTRNYASLEETLDVLRRSTRWRIGDRPSGDADQHYVDFGFRLDTKELPRPLQIGMGNQDTWDLELERQVQLRN